ncbi:hypothetical protein L3Y34_011559 [Caenorhabditis briggsae]|uniref:C2H2-type domain-containing protein n=2 Tax=Caenorhabditis briggsae TaxID=6238 RepID=A0AAE8ZP55_CAEBR|nr:hypothetical protein L3Y34_011559 [Caenorhabditis briggsae]
MDAIKPNKNSVTKIFRIHRFLLLFVHTTNANLGMWNAGHAVAVRNSQHMTSQNSSYGHHQEACFATVKRSRTDEATIVVAPDHKEYNTRLLLQNTEFSAPRSVIGPSFPTFPNILQPDTTATIPQNASAPISALQMAEHFIKIMSAACGLEYNIEEENKPTKPKRKRPARKRHTAPTEEDAKSAILPICDITPFADSFTPTAQLQTEKPKRKQISKKKAAASPALVETLLLSSEVSIGPFSLALLDYGPQIVALEVEVETSEGSPDKAYLPTNQTTDVPHANNQNVAFVDNQDQADQDMIHNHDGGSVQVNSNSEFYDEDFEIARIMVESLPFAEAYKRPMIPTRESTPESPSPDSPRSFSIIKPPAGSSIDSSSKNSTPEPTNSPETAQPTNSTHLPFFRESKSSRLMPAPCQVCRKNIKYASDRRRHILFHMRLKPWKCTTCYTGFTRATNAAFHFAREHPNDRTKPFFYELTREEEKTVKRNMKEYFIDEVPEKPEGGFVDAPEEVEEPAELPDYVDQNRWYAEEFMKDNTEEREDDDNTTEKTSSPEVSDEEADVEKETDKDVRHMITRQGDACKICSRELSFVSDQRRHVLYHLAIKPWKCPLCKKCYTRRKTVASHFVKSHLNQEFQPAVYNLSEKDKQLIDQKWMDYFPSYRRLSKYRYHPKDMHFRRVTCHVCSKEITNSSGDRRRHILSHLRIRPSEADKKQIEQKMSISRA